MMRKMIDEIRLPKIIKQILSVALNQKLKYKKFQRQTLTF